MFLGPLDEIELLLALGLLQVLLGFGAVGLRSGMLLRVDVDRILIIFLARKRRFVAVDLVSLLLDGIRVLNL